MAVPTSKFYMQLVTLFAIVSEKAKWVLFSVRHTSYQAMIISMLISWTTHQDAQCSAWTKMGDRYGSRVLVRRLGHGLSSYKSCGNMMILAGSKHQVNSATLVESLC